MEGGVQVDVAARHVVCRRCLEFTALTSNKPAEATATDIKMSARHTGAPRLLQADRLAMAAGLK
jgi:thymidine phosphorylase